MLSGQSKNVLGGREMPRRLPLRLRASSQSLEVVEPGWDVYELLRSVDPTFEVHSESLPGFTEPLFLRCREIGIALDASGLINAETEHLWRRHESIMTHLRNGDIQRTLPQDGVNLFSLKVELARRLLQRCTLCAHRCGVDRLAGERGRCGLGADATVAEHFVHIGEELPVNPSLNLSLTGCGLRCRYCQQHTLLNPLHIVGETLEPELWSRLDMQGARALSFVGGNPTESLAAIIAFLAAAPRDWQLPVVWNCHAYETPESLRLLDGVVDVYLPDFKYGSEACGQRLSSAPDYPETARAAVAGMLEQHVPVIVRILVLPGHFKCCHRPALDQLAALNCPNLFVSVRGQYAPDWKITDRDSPLSRRPTREEVDLVRNIAREHGLNLVA